jgi:hypothetical protein
MKKPSKKTIALTKIGKAGKMGPKVVMMERMHPTMEKLMPKGMKVRMSDMEVKE